MRLCTIAVASVLLFPAMVPAQEPVNQASIVAREVRHELLMLPNLTVFDDLSYSIAGASTGGAIVTLTGFVTQPALKSSAANVVKKLESVDTVVDNIEVLPLSPSDDRVRMAAYRKIYGDNTLSTRYGFRANPSIRIIVKNGNIRLTGFVANQFDRNVAGIRANEVRGAFSVTNELKTDNE